MDNFKNSNINVNELLKKAGESTNGKNMSAGDVNKFIDENLSEKQAATIKELLKDEEKTKAILNSDAAKSLFQKFFGGGSNG